MWLQSFGAGETIECTECVLKVRNRGRSAFSYKMYPFYAWLGLESVTKCEPVSSFLSGKASLSVLCMKTWAVNGDAIRVKDDVVNRT